ncbi:MAG TPA: class I SAM-dependent methyltransferase [Caulobacterales bacterium]|nr:class I SAM-dependent methyltransferase [Caulobacterales bacterium]
MSGDRRAYWDAVYQTKATQDASWFQACPEMSLKLIHRAAIAKDAAIVDIGGGDATFADHLLSEGYSDVSVLDISEAALGRSRSRLGERSNGVAWIAGDVTDWRPQRRFDLWHDRAALHFLTAADEQAAYAQALHAALKCEGVAIIAGFAPGGPSQCSGLDIIQHDAESLSALLGKGFALLETHGEVHLTPAGREQRFRYHIFRRRSDL